MLLGGTFTLAIHSVPTEYVYVVNICAWKKLKNNIKHKISLFSFMAFFCDVIEITNTVSFPNEKQLNFVENYFSLLTLGSMDT
jgi:hypothetical protein